MRKENLLKKIEKYTPEYISPIGIEASIIKLREAFKNKKFERCFRKYMRNARSNNWLKMHGYPMRRKGELA